MDGPVRSASFSIAIGSTGSLAAGAQLRGGAHRRVPLGSGLPTQENVHEVARLVRRNALLATARERLDFSEPVAVLLAAVTHFVSGADDPYGLVSALMDATVSGSHRLLSQATADMASDDTVSPLCAGVARKA
ncbi:SAM-dependent methyltransferase [Actinomadura bangladeshensis]|uniref:SAM-dependent methyltransferase n=1 Tax=Actinomadura bangladeshensis TaxID=453573 RepID=UPI001940830F|nr:SAM-dependent methyltransferase [Actinomadura bangladeshensis]